MKKAIVVGGSNGIGLAIARDLISRGYHLIILDVSIPAQGILSDKDYQYHYCDLADFNELLFEELKEDPDIDILMITAGLGRVTRFQYLHMGEIDKLMVINAVSIIKVIRIFYDRILSSTTFYCGVMGSIAGLVSSPLFAVYAASKAALFRFIESINIELDKSNTANRILIVAPGVIKGTKFNGGENNLSQTTELAHQIVEKLFLFSTVFIPQYDEIYKQVINQYISNPYAYGVHSYEYKTKSGRVVNENKAQIGYLSGTFDLFHIGHLNILKRAKQQCDYLIVGVHPDASHKGKQAFIPFDERKQIVASCKYVDKVVDSCKEDSDAWYIWHYTKLFVGSDYRETDRFKRYEEFFKDKNVEIVYFPYTKGTSSTQIREIIFESNKKNN